MLKEYDVLITPYVQKIAAIDLVEVLYHNKTQ